MIECEVREGRKGLWTDPHPMPSWEWRKKEKRSFHTTHDVSIVHSLISRGMLSFDVSMPPTGTLAAQKQFT